MTYYLEYCPVLSFDRIRWRTSKSYNTWRKFIGVVINNLFQKRGVLKF